MWPVNFLHVVLYAHSIAGTLRSQSSLLTLHIFVRAFSRILLKASTMPLAYGWYGVLFWWWNSNSSSITLMVLLMKCTPWSLIKILGHSNIVITCLKRMWVVVSMLQSFIGAASAHLVKYSAAVIIYLAPVLLVGGLMGPTNSISHFSNVWSVTCGHSGISSLLLGFPTHWQTSHCWQYSFDYLCIISHHNIACSTFYVVAFPT